MRSNGFLLRKLAAISLLLILLFNVAGYQVVIFTMQSNNAIALEKKLDQKEYADSELISIKTKLNLPYYQSSPSFERAYGSININGKDYAFVKRRVFNDTLELLCLPDKHKTELNTVKNEIAKSTADHQTSPDKKSSTVIKLNISEYLPLEATYIPLAETVCLERFNATTCPKLLPGYYLQQEHPPQSA